MFSALLGCCMPSLMLAVAADVFLKWSTDGERDLLALLGGLAGFALLPFTGLALVALPALDAHTRLLFGRSIAHEVTEKLPQPPMTGSRALARAMRP
jgi:hypothetical protein